MRVPPDNRITQLLIAWSEGDSGALKELTPLIYEQLRHLAPSGGRGSAGSITFHGEERGNTQERRDKV